MADRHSVVTLVGRNKEAQKTAGNLPMVFTEIALGSSDRFPSGGETALEQEVHRGAITGSGVEGGQPNAVWFDLYVPADVNTFHAQEIGLFDEDGTLYALSRFEQPVPKFGPDSSSTSDNTFRIIVVFSDTENVVVHTNPVVGITADNLSQNLPWATSEEAGDPGRETRIIDPKRLHDVLDGRTIAIAKVVGLSEVLDDKAAQDHTHDIEHVVGLNAVLTNKAQLNHAHDDRYLRNFQDDVSSGQIRSRRRDVSANQDYAALYGDILSNNTDNMSQDRSVWGGLYKALLKAPANAERNTPGQRFFVNGGRSSATALDSAGAFQDVIGDMNVAYGQTTGEIQNLWGTYGLAIVDQSAAGGYYDNVRGGTFSANIDGAVNIPFTYGSYSAVNLGANNPTVTNAYGKYVQMHRTTGTVDNAYGLYINYDGDWAGITRYGIWQANVEDNRFTGNIHLNGHSVWHDGRYFETGDLEFHASWFLTVTHPLGTRPRFVQAWLKCLTADLGYAPGDMLSVSVGDSSDAGGITARLTDTHLYCQVSNHGMRIRRPDSPIGDDGPITTANWRLIFGVFA